MTRKELGKILLADKDRWNEKVCYEDIEYSKIIEVTSCKSIQIDELQNGEMVSAQFPSRFCNDKFFNREQVTIIR